MHDPAPGLTDPEDLLRRWLAEDEALREGDLLEALMAPAVRIVRRIVEFKLRRGGYGSWSGTSTDIEDVCNTALANLISALARIKAAGDHTHIESFDDYTASIAFNACNEYFRRRNPERYSLANQLRYLLRHEPGLRLWKTRGGLEVCGDAAWEGRDALSLTTVLRDALPRPGSKRLSIPLLVSMFRANGGPLEFETLVEEVASLLGTRIHFTDAADLDREYSLIRNEPSVEEQLCARQFLQRLWVAIRGLPLHQKRAVLLNMQDSYGGDIQVFEASGVAGIRQFAEVLEIPLDEFILIWNTLPIDDKQIAAMCGISIQQTINCRSSARKALKKCMKKLDEA